MAGYKIRSVFLFSPHFKWATTRIRLGGFLYRVFSTLVCLLNERCESHYSAGNFVDSPWAEVCFQYLQWWASKPWIGVQWNVRLCTCGLLKWNYSLSRILVWHLLPAVNISMVSRECLWKYFARSSSKSALKMYLAIQVGSSLIFSPNHITTRTPRVGTPNWFN